MTSPEETIALHHVHAGLGEPLLLIHGLGGSWRSWHPVLPALSRSRELFVIDLPGHGASAPLLGAPSFTALTDAVESFVRERGLEGISVAGSSMGARMALELARRDVVGATVALDPGGFWEGWERRWLEVTLGLSVRMLRALDPMLPAITRSKIGRTLLLAQLSPRPWRLSPELVCEELRGYAATESFDALVADLAHGPGQEGARTTRGPIAILWGRQDRLTLPRQAQRAAARFPSARVTMLRACGHFPQWDQPDRTIETILETTGRARAQISQRATRDAPADALISIR